MKSMLLNERFLRKALFGCVFALPLGVKSQTVISVPSVGPTVNGPARPGLGGPKPASLSDISSAFAALPPPATWGPFHLRPHFAYTIVYGDGILRVPGEPVNTTVQDFFAGVWIEAGKHFTFDYTGGRTWNSSRLLADYTTHTAVLSAGIAKGDWNFGLSETYSSTSHTLVETGRQTPQVSYSTSGSVSYQLGPHILLDLIVTRNTRESDLPSSETVVTVEDLEQWLGIATVHYRFSPQLDVAIGMRIGYDRIANSSDMNTSQPQVTVTWRPTSKLTFTGQGGIETRSFRGSGADNLATEVYNVSASYQPTLYTTVAASANRSVSPSYYANQVSKSTGWATSFQQRVLERFYVTFGYSHGQTTYLLTEQDFQQGRDDAFNSFSAAVGTTFFTRGSISLTYTKSRNSSNTTDFAFSSRQIGAQVGYRY